MLRVFCAFTVLLFGFNKAPWLPMCWKSHPRSNSSRDYPLPPTRPTTRAAFVTWRATSALKAACRIRHNECSLCSASPVVKLAFHDNLRQILGGNPGGKPGGGNPGTDGTMPSGGVD